MTRAFVAHWKQHQGCAACIATQGKGMCGPCKRQALVAWHKYVGERVRLKLCINCPRKPQRGEQRCAPCAAENRQRCIDWYYRVGYNRVLAKKAAGTCTRCLKRPQFEQHTTCRTCYHRITALRQGRVTPTKKPYKFLSLEA